MIQMIYEKFEFASGKSALFELKTRLLADKTASLASLSDAYDFVRVFKAVLKEFDSKFTVAEKQILALAKKIRNKIVHSEFQAAFWMLRPEESGVKVITGLENLSGDQLLRKIRT